MRHSSKRPNNSPTPEQLMVYQSHGFGVIHNHVVNINPTGVPVEVDFSATDPDLIVQVAIKKAYEAGRREGEVTLQEKFRMLLGVETPSEA
jgi:hypothetical protein